MEYINISNIRVGERLHINNGVFGIIVGSDTVRLDNDSIYKFEQNNLTN